MSEKRYAIVGTGAVGGYYGGCLQRGGCDVHFLLRSDYDHVRQHGLRVDSKDGNFVLPEVHAYCDPSDMPPCDVVCIALKTTQNAVLGGILPRLVADDGVALVLQNGLGIEDDVARIVGPERTMGGLCFLCSVKAGPGHIHHQDYGAIALAEYSADGTPRGVTDRMRDIAADMERGGIPMRLEGDLLKARWMKLVWNIPYNGLCTILGSTTDRIMRDADMAQLVEQIMEEVVAGAAAYGRDIPRTFVVKMLDDTRKMVAYKPSMQLDHEAGRPMEVEAIFGNPIRAAEARGIDMPRVRVLYQQLAFLDSQRLDG